MAEADVQNSLAQVSKAAELYGVTEGDVDRWRAGIDERPAWAQRAHVSGMLAQRLVMTALEHRQECERADCRTCAGLREMLMIALAGVRTVVDDRLDELYRRPARWPWRRRSL
ncbi:hypothetical protein BJY16_004746 [Actinoplanes octamycinicus]|uniref:Uncharacterized protein n=1 Tax=Actinoplanes octamycinicus TaxID=135948 RepID=A0A7W7M8V5_9ACTN|nr:hypothetical protein [Actinoplanes octamycinicus]MBB4741287.1 hypothetical protein [Actinoplanes octamycinicus]GIE62912.1 hypothetical protein Aoc01nite_83140 [Actinoplanes octamycinicus]